MLPTWDEAKERVDANRADPVDIFIVNHEPAGVEDEKKFRDELQTLIDYIEACK